MGEDDDDVAASKNASYINETSLDPEWLEEGWSWMTWNFFYCWPLVLARSSSYVTSIDFIMSTRQTLLIELCSRNRLNTFNPLIQKINNWTIIYLNPTRKKKSLRGNPRNISDATYRTTAIIFKEDQKLNREKNLTRSSLTQCSFIHVISSLSIANQFEEKERFLLSQEACHARWIVPEENEDFSAPCFVYVCSQWFYLLLSDATNIWHDLITLQSNSHVTVWTDFIVSSLRSDKLKKSIYWYTKRRYNEWLEHISNRTPRCIWKHAYGVGHSA